VGERDIICSLQIRVRLGQSSGTERPVSVNVYGVYCQL